MRRCLIGFEYSATVREEFARLGWDAWSCDLLPSEKPGNHIQSDIYQALSKNWDLVMLHPPCTALSLSGNRYYGIGKPKHALRLESAAWTAKLWNHCRTKFAHCGLENPANIMRPYIGKRTQEIHPWQFGHLEQKKTWLWLHGLPCLTPTSVVYDEMMALPVKERQKVWYASPGERRGLDRARTYQGIAKAIAMQWTDYIENL